jgi:hypothetical protein
MRIGGIKGIAVEFRHQSVGPRQGNGVVSDRIETTLQEVKLNVSLRILFTPGTTSMSGFRKHFSFRRSVNNHPQCRYISFAVGYTARWA